MDAARSSFTKVVSGSTHITPDAEDKEVGLWPPGVVEQFGAACREMPANTAIGYVPECIVSHPNGVDTIPIATPLLLREFADALPAIPPLTRLFASRPATVRACPFRSTASPHVYQDGEHRDLLHPCSENWAALDWLRRRNEIAS